jgi:hypothetical protein
MPTIPATPRRSIASNITPDLVVSSRRRLACKTAWAAYRW